MKARTLARIAVAAIVALLACEVGLRVALPLAKRGRGVTYDEAVGWRPLPNVERVGEHWSAGVPARTNSLGWRDAEFAPARTPGTRRVLALGDSFTWGAGVDYGERWTERLEREIERLEVLNLGVNAFGCDQELRLLETLGLDLAPDVVVVQVFLGNDFDDVRYLRHFDWPKPHYELAAGELCLVPPVRTWDVDLRVSSYLGEALFRLLGGAVERSVRAPALAEADTTELLAAILARMERVARDRGAPLLALLVYPLERGDAPPVERERRLRELLDAAGVPALDLRAAFAEQAARGEPPYIAAGSWADGHWSSAGHALAAREVARELASRGWLR